MHWDTSKPPTFIGKLVADHLRDAERGRARIQAQAEWATEAELRSQLREVDAKLEVARLIGDGIIAAFFSASTRRKRLEALVEFQKLLQGHLGTRGWAEKAAWFSDDLLMSEHPLRPFHWVIEFPELFARENRASMRWWAIRPSLVRTRSSRVIARTICHGCKRSMRGRTAMLTSLPISIVEPFRCCARAHVRAHRIEHDRAGRYP